MAKWSSYHIFYYHQKNLDTVISMIYKYCDLKKTKGDISKWFYIRYWDGSPHIRLRILAEDSLDMIGLFNQIQKYIKDNPSLIELIPEDYYAGMEQFKESDTEMQEWFSEGEIISKTYVRESDRYGGDSLMDITEDLFMLSSELAWIVQEKSPDFNLRLLLSYALLEKMTKHLFLYESTEELASLFQGVIDFWGSRNHTSIQSINQFYHKNQSVLSKMQRVIAHDQKILKKIALIEQSIAVLKSQVTDKYYYNSIIISHIHMFCNRIGVAPIYEQAIYTQLLKFENQESISNVMGV